MAGGLPQKASGYNVAIVNASAKEEAAAIKGGALPHLPGRVQLIESDLGPGKRLHVGPGLLGLESSCWIRFT